MTNEIDRYTWISITYAAIRTKYIFLFDYSTSPSQLQEITLDPNESASGTIPCK
jgi:hypothetical protein